MSGVVIVDYGMGNLKSVQRGFEKIGATAIYSSVPEIISHADHLVLPGVGAFEDGIKGLETSGVLDAIRSFVATGNPLLGICLGMQMLLDRSEEHGDHQGLGLIGGQVQAIPHQEERHQVRKIPHIGWNELKYPPNNHDWSNSCLAGTEPGSAFYFVHSYMAVTDNSANLLAQCEYEGLLVTAAVRKENVTGLQFHPEKSGMAGLRILKRFINL